MRWLRWLRWTLVVVAGLAALAFGLAWWAMRQSLPKLEGAVDVPALAGEAIIERDSRGVPVITATTRTDVAAALGFAHAQDRFFPDGSVATAGGRRVVGNVRSGGVEYDRRTRRFGFRAVARRVIEAAPDSERQVIEAYTRGVNAGLASLGARPWEYLLLRVVPRAWAAEDSVLVVHSMWWQLQYGSLRDETRSAPPGTRRGRGRRCGRRARADRVRLRRSFRLGHA
jgi:penicillin amidase